jgi:hypothetical protein
LCCALDPFRPTGHLFTPIALSCAIFFYLGIRISCGVLRHDSAKARKPLALLVNPEVEFIDQLMEIRRKFCWFP